MLSSDQTPLGEDLGVGRVTPVLGQDKDDMADPELEELKKQINNKEHMVEIEDMQASMVNETQSEGGALIT